MLLVLNHVYAECWINTVDARSCFWLVADHESHFCWSLMLSHVYADCWVNVKSFVMLISKVMFVLIADHRSLCLLLQKTELNHTASISVHLYVWSPKWNHTYAAADFRQGRPCLHMVYVDGVACLHIHYVDAVSCLHIVYVDAMACLHIVQVILLF